MIEEAVFTVTRPRGGSEHAYDDERHGELRRAIAAELVRLMGAAYAQLGLRPPPCGG